jgi:hypothetical protein
MGAFSTSLNITLSTLLSGTWRPPQWGGQTLLYSMTCTLPSAQPASSGTGNAGALQSQATAQSPTTYFFDAVLSAEHTQELVCTEHPVQVGPAVVDHAYLRPARVVLEIAMSDAMASFKAGQYSSNASKSISAYQTFKQIQAARTPIVLATRLFSYQNMVIEDVRASDDNRTLRGFRGTLHLRQIISASVSTASVSVRPNATDTTNEGTKAPVTTPPTYTPFSQIP